MEKVKIVVPGSNGNLPILVVPAEREGMMIHPVTGLICGKARWYSFHLNNKEFVHRNGIVGMDDDTLIFYQIVRVTGDSQNKETFKEYESFWTSMNTVREVNGDQLLSILELVGIE